MTSVLRRQGDLSASHRPTVGDLKMSMVSVDHIGWLKCDGRQVPIDAFRHLYDVVGLSFGTDVSAGFFRLPNPQGRVLGMVGQSAGTSDWSMGDVSGEETHVLTPEEMPIHNHDFAGGSRFGYGHTDLSGTGITVVEDGTHSHTVNWTLSDDQNFSGSTPAIPNSDTGDTPSSNYPYSGIVNTAGAHTHTITDPKHRHRIAANGGDQSHNNIQPTIWIGSLFVYSGRLFRDAPGSGNYFPPQGSPYNIY
jgi:microcystin-dependent protein